MIPKIIHYCWFGGKELPKEVQKCINSWKKFCPDYKIIRWDESNYDVYKNPYTRYCFENKKWAFLSDYARLDIVYSHGGIYLDTDVEIIKSWDPLLKNECFLGMEQPGCINTGLGFGAKKGNNYIKENKEYYEITPFLKKNNKWIKTTCVKITSKLLANEGLTAENKTQTIKILLYIQLIFSVQKSLEQIKSILLTIHIRFIIMTHHGSQIPRFLEGYHIF